jgi:hypothetical protein
MWRRIQCRFLSNHRWEEKRIYDEKFFECRDCHKRHFGPHPPEHDLGAFASGSGM